MKWLWIPGAVIVAGVAVWLIAASGDRETEYSKVVRVLDRASAAVEHESTGRLVALLADDYSDDIGNSRTSIRQSLGDAFVGPQEWRATWDYPTIVSATNEEVTVDLRIHVQELWKGSLAHSYSADLRLIFARYGRDLRVRRVEGLKGLASAVEESYGY